MLYLAQSPGFERLVPPNASLGAAALASQSLWETKGLGSPWTHTVIFPTVVPKKRVMLKLEILPWRVNSGKWFRELSFLPREGTV